jgi:hypothetical protein
MNRSQLETLEKLKERLLSEQLLSNFDRFDEIFLLRFMRMRKFDLEKSFAMVKNYLKWREESNVDQIEVNYEIII